MDVGSLNLFMKLLSEEYKLNSSELSKISRRLMADSSEFDRVWKAYKNKPQRLNGKEDKFKEVIKDLLN